jgi:hypothetical protein
MLFDANLFSKDFLTKEYGVVEGQNSTDAVQNTVDKCYDEYGYRVIIPTINWKIKVSQNGHYLIMEDVVTGSLL